MPPQVKPHHDFVFNSMKFPIFTVFKRIFQRHQANSRCCATGLTIRLQNFLICPNGDCPQATPAPWPLAPPSRILSL